MLFHVLQRFFSVSACHDRVCDPVPLQRLEREIQIHRIVFDQQNRTYRGVHDAFSCRRSARRGNSTKNVAPAAGADSPQILPPILSSTFFTIASPAPVPSKSSCRTSRSNSPKIRSWYFISKPIPLSATSMSSTSPFSWLAMRIDDGCTFRLYFSALSIRLVKTCSRPRSHVWTIVALRLTVTWAPCSRIVVFRSLRIISTSR